MNWKQIFLPNIRRIIFFILLIAIVQIYFYFAGTRACVPCCQHSSGFPFEYSHSYSDGTENSSCGYPIDQGTIKSYEWLIVDIIIWYAFVSLIDIFFKNRKTRGLFHQGIRDKRKLIKLFLISGTFFSLFNFLIESGIQTYVLGIFLLIVADVLALYPSKSFSFSRRLYFYACLPNIILFSFIFLFSIFLPLESSGINMDGWINTATGYYTVTITFAIIVILSTVWKIKLLGKDTSSSPDFIPPPSS